MDHCGSSWSSHFDVASQPKGGVFCYLSDGTPLFGAQNFAVSLEAEGRMDSGGSSLGRAKHITAHSFSTAWVAQALSAPLVPLESVAAHTETIRTRTESPGEGTEFGVQKDLFLIEPKVTHHPHILFHSASCRFIL